MTATAPPPTPVSTDETEVAHAHLDRVRTRNTAYDDLIYQIEPNWLEDQEKILLGPFDYLFGHPGKDVRSQLIAAFDAWLQVPPESLAVITRVVGMLHTASLL